MNKLTLVVVLWIGLLATPHTQLESAAEDRPIVAIMIGEAEYKTAETLPAFADRFLKQNYNVVTILEDPDQENSFPDVAKLNQADVFVVSVRRKTLPPEQLDLVRKFIRDGKPVIGIRTANHAFCLRNNDPPEGADAWPEFDAEVFGGSYSNHYPKGSTSMVHASQANAAHPILNGMAAASFQQGGTLYQVAPLAEGAVVLMTGVMSEGTRFKGESVAGESEPAAWTFTRSDGGESFYTSLGHPADFENPVFQQLLTQAIDWAVSKP